MSKSFRYDPDEDPNTQMTAKQRRQLRKDIKQIRRERGREFEELEESVDSGM